MATLTQSNTPRYEGLHVTREEYLDLPDDGFQYDMIDGVLHMSPSAFFEHNHIVAGFVTCLTNYLRKNHLNHFLAPETDIFLPDGGDVLRPDISFVLFENRHIILGHIHGTPDLVCEVLSEATRERDLGVKANRYLSNGVKEYWILNPDDKSVQAWFNRGSYWDKKSGLVMESRFLPGLKIAPDEIFVNTQ